MCAGIEWHAAWTLADPHHPLSHRVEMVWWFSRNAICYPRNVVVVPLGCVHQIVHPVMSLHDTQEYTISPHKKKKYDVTVAGTVTIPAMRTGHLAKDIPFGWHSLHHCITILFNLYTLFYPFYFLVWMCYYLIVKNVVTPGKTMLTDRCCDGDYLSYFTFLYKCLIRSHLYVIVGYLMTWYGGSGG